MNGRHFIWVVDSRGLIEEFGYPPHGWKTPDYYGELGDGRRVLYEAKSKGNVNRARRQLEVGENWLRQNRQRVDMMGIVVVKLDGKQPWRRGQDGLLYSRRRIGSVPVRFNRLPVMVQEQWDQ